MKRRAASMGTGSKRLALPMTVVLLLAACAAEDPAPVIDRSQTPAHETAPTRAATPDHAADTYRVLRGDTLYAIAFKHGIDYRDIAGWNRIQPPYRIYVGQELQLHGPGMVRPVPAPVAPIAASRSPPAAAAPVATPPPAAAAPAKPIASTAPATSPTDRPGMFVDVPAAVSSPREAPAAAAPPPSNAQNSAAKPFAPIDRPSAQLPPTKPAAEPTSPRPVVPDSVAVSFNGISWRWPGKGSLIGTYVAGDQTRQGIDIAGKAGDAVLAAADGEVVYSGNGLLGYGELIIVKHNASFLSAYGHNRKRLVQEGEKIKGGQQIAEMGSSASARDELHFEIRKNGKPVNPLDYLPGR